MADDKFDPFADVNVDVNKPDAPPPPPKKDAGFDPFNDVKVDTDAPAEPAGGAAAVAASDPVEDDVVPGSRKDLWLCPHCGAKNKPGRSTCRSCSKSPDEKVVSPLMKQLPIIGGVVAVVLVIVVLVMSSGDTTEFKAAGAATMDERLRMADMQLAGSGRVLGSGRDSEHGAVWVCLVFGPQVTGDAFFELQLENDYQINVKQGEQIRTDVPLALVHFREGEQPPAELQRGAWLSFTGAELREPALRRFEYITTASRLEVREP